VANIRKKCDYKLLNPASKNDEISQMPQVGTYPPSGYALFFIFPLHFPNLQPTAMHIDQKYIDALRRNDARLIREIYQQHSVQILRWVQARGGSADEARDVFQDGLIVLFEKAQNDAFVLTCPLGALLHVICSRKYIDRLRQKGKDSGVRKTEERRYEEEQDSDILILAEESIAEQQKQERLSAAFAQLSDLCRQLLSLLSNGVAPREAADQLQMNSVDTLYRRKNACTERWRSLVLANA